MDESSWMEDRTVAFQAESQRDCRSLLNILQQASIKTFKLEVGFHEKYQLEQFDNEWNIQNDDDDITGKEKNIRSKYLLHKPQDYPKQEIMALGEGYFRGIVFMSVYKEELQKMQDDYRIKFLPYKSRLHIFMKQADQINIICKNRLLDMNHQLCFLVGYEQDLLLMLSSSSQLRKDLLSKGINVWFKKIRGNIRGLFFSITLNIKKMRQVIQATTQYDMAITNLNHKSLHSSQSSIIAAIIKECLNDSIKQIEYQYQLKMQVDQNGGYINMHYQHAIFGAQPSQRFQSLLNNLVIFSVKSNFVRQLDNKMKKNIKKMPFLAEKIHRRQRQTFLAINVVKLFENADKLKENIEQFLKMFQGIVQKNFQIKLYFNYMKQATKYIQKIIKNAEDNNLIISNQPGQMKIVLKLKDFSEGVLIKRFKEVVLFLQNMITPQNKKLEQSITESFINQDKSFISSQTHTHSFSQLMEEKYKLSWLKIVFTMPKLYKQQEEDRDFIKGRRNRQMQSLFNKQGSYKFKIWSIQISQGLNMPASWQQNPYLLKGAHKGNKLKTGYSIAALNSFDINQQGLVAFLTKQLKEQFIPVLIFQRLQ